MTKPDNLCERLEAIGEEEMYQAPATTKATIDKAAALIRKMQARIEEMWQIIGRAAVFLQIERDSLVDSHTSPPGHDLSTLDPAIKDDIAEWDSLLNDMSAALSQSTGME